VATVNDIIWERQQGESGKAFEAFAIYRDSGSSRTFQLVADRLQKSSALVRRWAKNYDWEERARAYDNYLDKQQREKAEREIKDMTTRHIKTAMGLQQKAITALKEITSEDMTTKNILDFIKTGCDMERAARLDYGKSNEPERGIQAATSLADFVIHAHRKRIEEEKQKSEG
jgi:hypothetical protein